MRLLVTETIINGEFETSNMIHFKIDNAGKEEIKNIITQYYQRFYDKNDIIYDENQNVMEINQYDNRIIIDSWIIFENDEKLKDWLFNFYKDGV
jgi:hypothetical protein